MNKKLYAVLEQGSKPNTRLAKNHKKEFSKEYCDFFRLNWANKKNDKTASFFAENITWSEGRSFLFEKSKDKYKYYVFIDDDIVLKFNKNKFKRYFDKLINLKNSFFDQKSKSISSEIARLLEKYQPIHASIPSTRWPHFVEKYKEDVFLMRGGDLCVQIFRSDFANLMFPTLFHGSGGSMWYAQFIAHQLYPEKSIFFNTLKAINTVEINLKGSIRRSKNVSSKQMAEKFSKLLKPEYQDIFRNWKKNVENTKNRLVSKPSIEYEEIDVNYINSLFIEPVFNANV